MASSTSAHLHSISLFSQLLLIVVTVVVSFLILSSSRRRRSKRPNLPPGPAGWPVVGNLVQFLLSGKLFIHYVRDLLPAYGPIFTLKIGTRTLIVISGGELAHEALITNGQAFASRPLENPTRAIFSCNKFTVNSAVYGPVWRSLRRNMVAGMLSSGRLKEFSSVRDVAMDRLINRLRSEAEVSDGSVRVLPQARFSLFCILLSMCFGLELDEETIENVDRVMKRVLLALNTRLDDFLPVLRPLYYRQRNEATLARRQQIQTVVPLIERRRSELRLPSPEKKSLPFAYVDTLFDLEVEGRHSAPSHEELVTLCSEFLNGGTDTTATAVEWAIARLIESPEIQTRLYRDVVSVAGGRRISDKDVEKMQYLNAFTKELLRRHPPTYFSLTHAVVRPTTLAGYEIPTDVNVDFYVPGISEDPRYWTEPEKFRPERFLSGEDVDMTGTAGIKMLPFGAGRRICPGLGMAVLHINLLVARMVQEFEWYAHSQCPIEFNEKVEFTVVMQTSLRARIKPRKPMPM